MAKNKKEGQTRRPPNTAFRQQRLKAWQPVLTPKVVIPLYLVLGIIFTPIGGILFWRYMSVPSLTINYTNCINQTLDKTQEMPGDLVKASFKKSDDPVKVRWTHWNTTQRYPLSNANLSTEMCRLEFNVPQDLEAPIYLYYTMTNFYQNHRKYVKSFFDKQLKGDVVSYGDIAASDCSPLSVDGDTKKAYYPCGLIANSVFNDTIENPVKLTSGDHRDNVTYEMSETNIAWESDTKLYGPYPTQDDPEYKKIQPPSFWRKQWPNGYTKEQPPPDLSKDEHLMVWMRTAGLPSFSKLYMSNTTHGMQNGTYQIEIWDNFPSWRYGGTKSIYIISWSSSLGAQNPFLGILYLTVGGLFLILGVVFAVLHLFFPRKLGDHTYLSWDEDGDKRK
jgi:hypothetical protein